MKEYRTVLYSVLITGTLLEQFFDRYFDSKSTPI